MVISFESDRVTVDIRGGFATVECHRYDRWHRISGPFREMKGDVLEEALEDVPCTVTVLPTAVMVKAADEDGGELTIWFADRPSITGGWWEE